MPRAHLVRPHDAARIAWIGGSTHDVVLDAAATDGRLTVMRSTFQGGAASPVHVHPSEDETLIVQRGTLAVWAGADRWDAGPGDVVFLARGVPHTYLVTSDTADVTTICTPSGMELFFERAGWDLRRGPVPDDWQVDMAGLQAAAAQGGQVILGPPLGVDDVMPAELLQQGPTTS